MTPKRQALLNKNVSLIFMVNQWKKSAISKNIVLFFTRGSEI